MKQHQPNLARYVADNKDKWLNEDLLSKVQYFLFNILGFLKS